MGQLSKLACISLVVVLFSSACTSKFEDKDPDSQNTNGFSVDGSLNANEDLDKKLQQLENNAEKVRSFLRSFRRLQNAQQGQENYTQIDFLLDANEQLNQAPSRRNGEGYVREGHIKLKFKGVAAECQVIDTRLETMSRGGTELTDIDANGVPVDGVIYSVRTCRSAGQHLPVATVTFTSKSTSVEFNSPNIRRTLVDVLQPVVQVNANCQLNVDAQNVLAHAECTNLSTNFLNGRLLFESVVYDRYDDVRFALEGKIYEDDLAKGKVSFSVRANGKVTGPFIEKIQPPARAPDAAPSQAETQPEPTAQ